MNRLLLKKLLDWKSLKDRKPLMLGGARQVGKSYLIEKLFGEKYFDKVFKINFEDTPNLKNIFNDSLKADDLVDKISIHFAEDFNSKTDLLFFDEIGLCEEALNSLKYFREQRPDIYLCASGSNIGLIKRYPVGQTHELTLYPMNLEEFVMASQNMPLYKAYEQGERSEVIHEKMIKLYHDFLFVGGMPAAVLKWFDALMPIIKKSNKVREIQKNLIKGYVRDFGKYDVGSKVFLSNLETVFRDIPRQLSHSLDVTVNRYSFSKVVKGKDRYKDFKSMIDYLVSIHLVSKTPIIEGAPETPLTARATSSRFKLFCHDVGILHALLEIPYQKIVQREFSYKGYLAENFAQNELLASGVESIYSWESGRSAELEFILTNAAGDVIPIEIKSGKNTKAKSLNEYIKTYSPVKAYKLCELLGGERADSVHTRPLYYVSHVADSILNRWEIEDYF